MKKLFFTAIITAAAVFLQTGINCFAQSKPLNGSGKIISKSFDFKNFDKLEILDLAGKVNVEVGKPFSVNIDIDDNLESLLRVKENNGELTITLQGNNYNKLYVEETNIKVTVTMPEVSVVRHRSNSNMNITGITGRYFRVKSTGNGSVTLNGSIDELDIICHGNGAVKAEGMVANLLKVQKSGNGNVYIKTDSVFTATGSGNGDVINKGEGIADKKSGISGNGQIRYTNQPVQKLEPVKKVQVKIKNETDQNIELQVKYPVKGSYGINIKANKTVRQSFPVGTKLYRTSQSAGSEEAVYEVTGKGNELFVIR